MFTILKWIDSGAYGDVYKVQMEYGSETLAAKRIRFRGREDVCVQREIDALCRLNHDNIVAIKSVLRYPTSVVILEELANLGSVQTFFQNGRVMSMTSREMICVQLITAVQYCHIQNVCHLDINPTNVLLVNNSCLNPDLIVNNPTNVLLVNNSWVNPELVVNNPTNALLVNNSCLNPELVVNNPEIDGSIGLYDNGSFVDSESIIERTTFTGRNSPNINDNNLAANRKKVAGFRIKLCDFGQAVCGVTDDTMVDEYLGLVGYKPPEVLMETPYSPRPADVWSMGCVIGYILTSCHVFSSDQSQISGQSKVRDVIDTMLSNISFDNTFVRNVINYSLLVPPTSRVDLRNLDIKAQTCQSTRL